MGGKLCSSCRNDKNELDMVKRKKNLPQINKLTKNRMIIKT